MKPCSLNETVWELNFPANNTSTPSLSLRSSQVATSATMFSFGVIGNLIAIVVLCTSKKEQKETTFYTLICGLAITDLLGTCFTSPVVIATYIANRWPGGQLLCQFFSFSMLFFGSAGMTILCAMAIERYLAINHAYFYSHHVDRTLARLSLLGAYFFNLVLCIMPSFGIGRHVRHFPGTWCFLDWRATDSVSASYSYLYGSFMLILIAVTVFCNLAVCGSLVQMSQRTQLVRAEGSRQGTSRCVRRFPRLTSGTSPAEIQMFWLLIFMTIVFLVCSIPLVVRIFINQLYGPMQIQAGEKIDFRGDLLAIRFASFNPILDPWVYILCRKNLLIKGCERVKRTVGIMKDGHNRKVGWVTGQQTPPSYANSVTTSYASLRIRDETKELQKEFNSRTKSFTDFSKHFPWEVEGQAASFHPFSVPQDSPAGLAKTPLATHQQTKAIMCTIMQDTPTRGHQASISHLSGQERNEKPFDVVSSSLDTSSSSALEKCI
ncbi:prostaglandin E2 receptor EP4 subtype-like [Protopterus annectens]|uniref:prostaglandin E2 receptor EP4 subtype-like n=1 Tax=Protopterus annectens TaxID=7888 RepID=UPI001CFB6599|nr:prostaglandin E2 receptor EP4 subtype-like [Protopterus annectens]